MIRSVKHTFREISSFPKKNQFLRKKKGLFKKDKGIYKMKECKKIM